MFDDLYYSQKYNVPLEDAFQHYNEIGYLKKYQPSPYFDIDWFYKRYSINKNINLIDYTNKNFLSPNMYWANENWSINEINKTFELDKKINSTVIIGLLGTGRTLLSDILDKSNDYCFLKQEGLENCGFQSRTPLIYTGHATISKISSFQKKPNFTYNNIIQPMQKGYHQVIFMLRHPLDTLFSNFFWWHHCLSIKSSHSLGISSLYKNLDDFIEFLEINIQDFENFIDTGEITPGNNGFGKFLTFSEFLIETINWTQLNNVNVFKFENFLVDYDAQIERLEYIFSPIYKYRLTKSRILGKNNNYRYICQNSNIVKNTILKNLRKNSKFIYDLNYEIELK